MLHTDTGKENRLKLNSSEPEPETRAPHQGQGRQVIWVSTRSGGRSLADISENPAGTCASHLRSGLGPSAPTRPPTPATCPDTLFCGVCILIFVPGWAPTVGPRGFHHLSRTCHNPPRGS